MAKKIDPTKLGIFVIVAVGIVVLAIAVLGRGNWFKKQSRFVIVFPESVSGLSIGSAVRFRGIQLGTVVEMHAVYNQVDNKIAIPIYVEIDREQIRNLGAAAASSSEQQENLLKAGIRAQLVTDSIVTGQKAVSLDFRPEMPVRITGIDSAVPEIASIPSPLEAVSETLQSLPLQDIVAKFNSTLTAIEQVVTSPEFADGVKGVGPTLTEARKSMEVLSTELSPLLSELRGKIAAFDAVKISTQLESSLAAIDLAADNIAALSAKGAPLDNNASRALTEIASAARELRQVAEMIQRRPEVFLTGKN